jgi:hypothetical protein
MGKVLRRIWRHFRSAFYAMLGSKQDQATENVRVALEDAVQVDVKMVTTKAIQTLDVVREQMKKMMKQVEAPLGEMTQMVDGDDGITSIIHAEKALQTAVWTSQPLRVVSAAEWEIEAFLRVMEKAKAKTQAALVTVTAARNIAIEQAEAPEILASWSSLQITLQTAIDDWEQAGCRVKLMMQVMNGIRSALGKVTQVACAVNELIEQKQQAMEQFYDAAHRLNRANDDCIQASLSEIVGETALDRCHAQETLQTATETEESILAEIRERADVAAQADLLFHRHIATIASALMQISLSSEDASEIANKSSQVTKTATVVLQHAFAQMRALAE